MYEIIVWGQMHFHFTSRTVSYPIAESHMCIADRTVQQFFFRFLPPLWDSSDIQSRSVLYFRISPLAASISNSYSSPPDLNSIS